MKVLFVSTSYPIDEDDPRGNHVRVLGRQLAHAGDQVSVIAPARHGQPRHTDLEGVAITRFAYWPGGGSLNAGVAGIVPALREQPIRAAQIAPLIVSMRRTIHRLSPSADVLHAHWLYPSGVLAVRAGRKHGKPVVITAHGGDVELATRHTALSRTVSWAVNNADMTMAVSDDIARSLVALGGRPDRVVVAPLGVPLPAETAHLAADPPRFLFVGSLIHRKGIDILLDAADGVDEGVMEIVLVGDGPLRGIVESRARVNPTIRPLGAKSPSEVAQLMLSSSSLVLPSRSEGRPFVIMEAMAAGLPVLATDIPGSRELVHDGLTGLLCEMDAAALREGMLRLASDAALRERFGKAGRARLISEKLTVEHAAARVRNIYSSADAAK
jgi:glycosyltransferase involved in cell wall biosynthesis